MATKTKRRKRKKHAEKKELDRVFGKRFRTGTKITVRVPAELLHVIDGHRSDLFEQHGVELDRGEMLTAMINKGLVDKYAEGNVLAGGERVTKQGGETS